MAKKGGVGECENKLRKSYGNLETSESGQDRRRKNNYTMQINKEEREKEREEKWTQHFRNKGKVAKTDNERVQRRIRCVLVI